MRHRAVMAALHLHREAIIHVLSQQYFICHGKIKRSHLYLERAMEKAPKLLKRFVELNPSILQNQQVVDILAKFKRNKSI